MRVLVCGGREYNDEASVFAVLDALHAERPVSALIHGAARGADTLAASWARCRGVQGQAFPANWRKHGKAAGAIRNAQMLEEGQPVLVVAFPGGPGTADMKAQARRAGVEVREEPLW